MRRTLIIAILVLFVKMKTSIIITLLYCLYIATCSFVKTFFSKNNLCHFILTVQIKVVLFKVYCRRKFGSVCRIFLSSLVLEAGKKWVKSYCYLTIARDPQEAGFVGRGLRFRRKLWRYNYYQRENFNSYSKNFN